MTTVTEMRAWLRDQGHDVPDRGRLRPELTALYNDAHAAPDGDDDIDAGITDLDFPDVDPPDADEPAPAKVRDEVRPVRPREPRPSVTSRVFGPRPSKPDPKKGGGRARKAPARVSLEKFTSRIYDALGRSVSMFAPATGRCLSVQSNMAACLVDPMIAGTVADRFLQPVARAEEKLNAGFAILAPPLCVFALEMTEVNPNIAPQQKAIRGAMIAPILRESLRIGLELSEGIADQIQARAERNMRYDADVDRLLSMIFPPEAPQRDSDASEAEYATMAG